MRGTPPIGRRQGSSGRRSGWPLLLSASLVSATIAPLAFAQTDPQQKAAAEALFDEGRQLFSQGLVESACKRFEQSEEIDPGVGTLMYLADCYEKIGKLASAWATYREASSAATAKGQADRGRIADDHARKLSTSLSKLVLLVPGENRTPGFELLLDNKPQSPALFGVPFPVDAGQHELLARSPGRNSWSTVIEVKSNADYRTVEVPVLSGAAPGTQAAVAPAAAGTLAAASPSNSGVADSTGHGSSSQKTIGLVVGGVGLVAIGTGVAFGLRASDKDDQAKPDCPDQCRTQAAAELNSSARSAAVVANISYALGLVGLGTGVVLYLTAGSDDPGARAALQVTPLFGAVDGVAVSGAF